MLNIPLTNYLYIFQLENYQIARFFSWWFRNLFYLFTGSNKKVKFTSKAKAIVFLSAFSFLLTFVLLVCWLKLAGIFLSLFIFVFLSPLYLILAKIILLPGEQINKLLIFVKAKKVIEGYKNLTTIGITGSYGKTTTKNFLYQILDFKNQTVKTPHSYNTFFGLARVIDEEITKRTKYFIAEMSAYKKGEIEQLAKMVMPDYGIITAVGKQHLERFGSLENIFNAKFELAEFLNGKSILLNTDSGPIRSVVAKYPDAKTYSMTNPEATFFMSSFSQSKKGVSFTVKAIKKNYQFTAPIFGTANLQNLLAAISMAFLLRLSYKTIKSAVGKLSQTPHRLEMRNHGRLVIIDNTYSSNVKGFSLAMDDFSCLRGKKALVTPGVVELGKDTKQAHFRLGKKAARIFNTIVLVGKTERTSFFEKGIKAEKTNTKTYYLTDKNEYWNTVFSLEKDHNWVLLENDLTENY